MEFTNERNELANEAAFGLTEADYVEMADVFAEIDEAGHAEEVRGTVCDCDYCGEISLCYPDGAGGKACQACMCDDCDPYDDEPGDGFRDDVEADADVLRMAGWGTDEDYGYDGMDYDFDMYSEGEM